MSKKVLIVDDSVVVRKHLSNIISAQGHIVETAKDGQEACDKAVATNYDAITMDINMPVVDGLSAVKKIMQTNPTAIIMVSALTRDDAEITFDALALGAVAAIEKTSSISVGGEQTQYNILQALEEAFSVPKENLRLGHITKAQTRDFVSDQKDQSAQSIVLIGSSTGGPHLIEEICYALPADYPHAVCVTQHMPENFITRFAQRLDSKSKLPITTSKDSLEVLSSHVYIAKGGDHLHFKKQGARTVLMHGEASKKTFFIPSVDEMYFSSIDCFEPKNILAVQLTGIGDDGADGMVALKKAGAYTIAESQETATIFGMPKEAIARGGTKEALPFPKILDKILQFR